MIDSPLEKWELKMDWTLISLVVGSIGALIMLSLLFSTK